MNAFQWLLVLGFPPEVAASTVQPDVFAHENTVTPNDLLACPEVRDFSRANLVFDTAA